MMLIAFELAPTVPRSTIKPPNPSSVSSTPRGPHRDNKQHTSLSEARAVAQEAIVMRIFERAKAFSAQKKRRLT
jgi:hypothetical protein